MKYSHREPTLIATHVVAMTHEDFLKQDFKIAYLELCEQLEYKCYLANVISSQKPKLVYVCCCVFTTKLGEMKLKSTYGEKNEKDKLPLTSNL